MKLLLICAIFIFGLTNLSTGQSANDVLDKGIKIKSGNQIFVRHQAGKLFYQQGTAPVRTAYVSLNDSIILLPAASSINIYLEPMNPLNFSYKSETKMVVDPIDSAAAGILNQIIEKMLDISNKYGIAKPNDAGPDTGLTFTKRPPFCDLSSYVQSLQKITEGLKQDKKPDIVSLFKALKNIDFETEQRVTDSLLRIDGDRQTIISHYNAINKAINNFSRALESLTCPGDIGYEFIARHTFTQALDKLKAANAIQLKRLTNLSRAYDVLVKYRDSLSGVGWLIKIEEASIVRGKITIVTIKISESGFALSGEEEIVSVDAKEKASRAVRFRRFSQFVPEVAAGVVYTKLSFLKYGTATDAAGKQVVAEAGEENINRYNVAAMLNYNLFVTNSPLIPFWQIGLGVNAGAPTLLTGVGLRISSGPVKRLALTIGLATTWIKTLDKLKVGDVVSGTADLEKDLKYRFNDRPKMYFGVQYNF